MSAASTSLSALGLRVGQPTAAGSHEWVDTSLLHQTPYHTLIWYTLILLIPYRHIWNSWDSPEPSAWENKTCAQLCEQNLLRSWEPANSSVGPFQSQATHQLPPPAKHTRPQAPGMAWSVSTTKSAARGACALALRLANLEVSGMTLFARDKVVWLQY